MTIGKYSRSRMLSVTEIIEEYRQELVDADATDEDLLYLSGYLMRAVAKRPVEEDVAVALEELTQASEELNAALSVFEPESPEELGRVNTTVI
jgi:hypothetical protein